MKVKFANKIYEVLCSKEVAGKTIYAVEDEPNHVDWLVNVEVVDTEEESEDEKVRKEIIKLVKFYYGQTLALKHTVSRDKMLAWLEKQEEQKINDIGFKAKDCYVSKVDGKIHIASKLGPKFRDGDWIIDKQGFVHQIKNVIANVTNDTFGYYIVGGGYFNDNSDVRLWTIQDAKDGDVLIDKSHGRECPFIFKETKPSDIKADVLNPLTVLGYCGIGGAGFTKGCGWGDTANCTYYPATKEQRDLLFQKMKEAGYEWDSNKKELIKL